LSPDPLESPGGNKANNEEIVPAEAVGVLPVISILIRALEGDIEDWSFLRLLLPNACGYGAVTNLVNWLLFRSIECLVFHTGY
jgi:hypothetical protein